MEGLITIFAGIIFTLLIPPKAGDGKPLISMGRWSYFTERESQIIRDRVILDDPLKVQGHIKITGRDIWDTIRKPNMIQHFMVSLVAMSAYQGLTHYTPSMIKSFGFDSVDANALTSVPVYCSMAWTLVLAYLSDWLGHRGPFVLLAITWNVIAYPCLRTTPWDSSQWHKYGVICVANVAYISMQCVAPHTSQPDPELTKTKQHPKRRLAIRLLRVSSRTEYSHGVCSSPSLPLYTVSTSANPTHEQGNRNGRQLCRYLRLADLSHE